MNFTNNREVYLTNFKLICLLANLPTIPERKLAMKQNISLFKQANGILYFLDRTSSKDVWRSTGTSIKADARKSCNSVQHSYMISVILNNECCFIIGGFYRGIRSKCWFSNWNNKSKNWMKRVFKKIFWPVGCYRNVICKPEVQSLCGWKKGVYNWSR